MLPASFPRVRARCFNALVLTFFVFLGLALVTRSHGHFVTVKLSIEGARFF